MSETSTEVPILIFCQCYNTGKLQDAQKVLKDTIATIEKSVTAKETFCQVSNAILVAAVHVATDDYLPSIL